MHIPRSAWAVILAVVCCAALLVVHRGFRTPRLRPEAKLGGIPLPPLPPPFAHTLVPVAAPESTPRLPRPIPDAFIPHWDLAGFNYTGACGAVFRHPPHSSRDVVLLSHGHNPQLATKQFYEETNLALHFLRRTLPNARVVVFLFGEVDEKLTAFFGAFGVEMYLVKGLAQWHAANARIPVAYEFLRQHLAEFDRAVWSDTRDIYHFADVFATFSADDLIFMAQGLDEEPTTFANEPTAFYWMEKFVSRTVAEQFAHERRALVNFGYGVGGARKVAALLGAVVRLMDARWGTEWGYEQTVLNWAFHTGRIDDLHLALNHCCQRMCFLATAQFDLSHNVIRHKRTGCSPVVWHKGLPHGGLPVNFLP